MYYKLVIIVLLLVLYDIHIYTSTYYKILYDVQMNVHIFPLQILLENIKYIQTTFYKISHIIAITKSMTT